MPTPNPGDHAGIVQAAIISAIGRSPQGGTLESGSNTSTIIIHPDLILQGVTPAILPVPWVYGNGVTVTVLPLTNGQRVPVTIVVFPAGLPLTPANLSTIRSLLSP